MSSRPDTFDADWLALREPFDHRARNRSVAERFIADLPADPVIADLGAGAASTVRALAPLIERPHEWILAELSPDLQRAGTSALLAWSGQSGWSAFEDGDALVIDRPNAQVRTRWRTIDLARDIGGGLDGCNAVAMSALLDLISRSWLEELVLAVGVRPVYAALSVTGLMTWSPEDPDDERIGDLFECDQRRDKGFGPALGADAPACLGSIAANAGRTSVDGDSDWRISQESPQMLSAMVSGAADAAARQGTAEAQSLVGKWRARRMNQLEQGSLSLVVGHRDQLIVQA